MAYIDINDTDCAGCGDATAANQLQEIALLTNINNKIPPLGKAKNIYNESLALPSGILSTITTYTVPSGKTSALERVSITGDNIAFYQVLINNVVIDSKHTMFGMSLNTDFNFISPSSVGLSLIAGDIVTVKILHNRPFVGNFSARIQATEF